MSLLFLTGCYIERYYTIDELGMNMFVDRIDAENKIYRVYLLSKQDSLINDYLDVRIPSSDMPAISLHFPVDKSDTVFVLDRWNNVKNVKSSKFKFLVFNNAPHTVGNSTQYNYKLRDSIFRKIKAVDIEVYLNGVTIWDENNNRRGIFKIP